MKITILAIMTLILTACGRDGYYAVPVPGPTITVTVTVPTDTKNITCEVFDLQGMNFNTLPDFDSLTPAGTIQLGAFDSYVTNNTKPFQPFVGTPYASMVEYFGMDCTSKIKAPVDGSYTFSVTSDDATKLYIDGRQVIDNDNQHGMQTRTGNLYLKAGLHKIRLGYQQGNSDKGLYMVWTVPGGVSTLVDEDSFSL